MRRRAHRARLGATGAILSAMIVCSAAFAVGERGAIAEQWSPAEGASLIGKRAPAWQGLRWLAGGPLTLAGLRGHPVLIRFWTDGCPYCAGSSTALTRIWKQYRARGLVVIGIHHPKSEESRDPEVIRRAARAIGFEFPIATDPDWLTVKAYGVGKEFTKFTSVSALVDGEGVIRWVHDGGTIEEGGAAVRSLEKVLEGVLRLKQ